MLSTVVRRRPTSRAAAALLFAGAISVVAPETGAAPAPDARQLAEAREIFRSIVEIPSTEHSGRVRDVADALAKRFLGAGFPAADVTLVPVGDTVALVVRYRGTGRGGRPILLNAHMDVVAAKREDWLRDPFTLVEENGYYYGRGTWDDKLDVATLSATLLRLKAEKFVPSRDLILALTGDEETEQTTARELIAKHRDLIDAEFCLSGDAGQGILEEASGRPLYYQMSGAEKGYADYELRATNPGGHSSMPREDNAIYDLAEALQAIRAYRFPVKSNEWTRGGFAAQGPRTPGPAGEAMTRFAKDPTDAGAIDVLRANPAYVGQIGTTCVATRLDGGHANNALPQSAVANVNCRIFPGETGAETLAVLQKLAGPRVAVTMKQAPIVAPASPWRADVARAVEKAVHATHPGVPLVPRMEPGATEGAEFRGIGIPTYGVQGIFVKASDDFTHGLNERVPVSALPYGLTHWYVLLRELAGSR
jgi:acetylornithine deacetylase/succinyl-diaminopimelate desuccinylase-like protein